HDPRPGKKSPPLVNRWHSNHPALTLIHYLKHTRTHLLGIKIPRPTSSHCIIPHRPPSPIVPLARHQLPCRKTKHHKKSQQVYPGSPFSPLAPRRRHVMKFFFFFFFFFFAAPVFSENCFR